MCLVVSVSPWLLFWEYDARVPPYFAHYVCNINTTKKSERTYLHSSVVACQTVDARLDENQAELGVLVAAVAVEVLSDGDRLLDELEEVLRQFRRESVSLKDAHDFRSRHGSHLRDTVLITKRHPDLRRRHTLTCESADGVDDFLVGDFQPGWRRAFVGEGTGRHALALAVHATHDERW